MNEWNKLSMADRAAYIKLGIDNGITDLATIREVYNKYAEGGYVRELNNHPVSFDEEGNLTDLVTGEKGNKFEEGGSKDTYFGLTTDDWKDVGLGLLPVVGTINDALTFWEEPSLINGMGLGVSVATDVATLFGIGAAAKGAKSLYRAYKAKETLSNARRIAAKQAANKYKLTRMDRVLNTATNKEVKSSMQSMLAKKQNAELARQKAELANALFWNYTKAEMKNNAKQIASPLKIDTGMNILLNLWNTNM